MPAVAVGSGFYQLLKFYFYIMVLFLIGRYQLGEYICLFVGAPSANGRLPAALCRAVTDGKLAPGLRYLGWDIAEAPIKSLRETAQRRG